MIASGMVCAFGSSDKVRRSMPLFLCEYPLLSGEISHGQTARAKETYRAGNPISWHIPRKPKCFTSSCSTGDRSARLSHRTLERRAPDPACTRCRPALPGRRRRTRRQCWIHRTGVRVAPDPNAATATTADRAVRGAERRVDLPERMSLVDNVAARRGKGK